MKRRTLIAVSVATALGALTLAPAALAQAYPVKPVRVIVPYPAGGIVDLMTRAVTDRLSGKLGQPVVVEAKPGASTSIGTDTVAKADPDGYTLLMATLAFAVAPQITKVPWDPVKDFTGVAHMGVVANIVAVHPSLGVKDLKGLVALAKAKNGQLNYMNPGNGSSPHVSAELFQQVHDVRLTSINYKGVPTSIPDFLRGAVPFGFFPYSTIVAHVRSGKAVAIAIASPVRHKQFPDLPTMSEQGFKSSQVNSWYAFAAPKNTPAAIVDRLNKDINDILNDPETVTAVDRIGGTIVAGWTPQQTTQMFADEGKRWAGVIEKAGIKAQ